MKTLTFILLSFSCATIFAQSTAVPKTRYSVSKELQSLKEDTQMDVRVTNYIFRKIDKNRQVVEFTLLDAVKLESFFMKQAGVMACETHSLDKIAKVTTQPTFDYKALIPDLEKMGYIITGLRSTLSNVTFAAKGSCNDKALNASANTGDSNCYDCGKQQVKQDLLEKFKDADYGGTQIIDFDLGTPGSIPTDTSVASDQNN